MLEDLWYKNAIVYCLDVETFQDGNGDGIGDFVGLARRLDYLAGLGVTCVWLLPFFPSPNRDNGYDISDFYGVDPRLGDLGDFVAFSHRAKQLGIRVIVDLVVNHTSDQHPWFQEARRDPNSKYRAYYSWSEKKPRTAHEGMVFPGSQTSVWSWDETAGAYYFHRFHEFQPDLDIGNPAVRAEILKAMGYWLELGVSGFRVDAVPFLIEHAAPTGRPKRAAYEFLREMREFLSWRRGDAILLAEANVPVKDAGQYFGEQAERMQMVFNFIANQRMFLGLATEDARPLARVLHDLPELPVAAQWAVFLRNHDELDLGRLSARERAAAFEAFGPDPDMQLYDRGLRRRLAPMLSGDADKLELAYSLLFALPGTPVVWYGDEIGMGELLSLTERESVRTPMQWANASHGGFTTAKKPVKPLVARGPFSFSKVNVASQRCDPDSLLNRIERLIRLRKECPEIGWGHPTVLGTGDAAVLALRYEWRGRTLVTVHNFAASSRVVRLDARRTADSGARLDDLLCRCKPLRASGRRYEFDLEAHGYRWLRPTQDSST